MQILRVYVVSVSLRARNMCACPASTGCSHFQHYCLFIFYLFANTDHNDGTSAVRLRCGCECVPIYKLVFVLFCFQRKQFLCTRYGNVS